MKISNFENLEILSPAGSPECFYANINNGCDAVYLGLSDFNARMKAQNFTVENIRDYVKHAHKFGVKVYVTVNTLLNNEDFNKFIEMIKSLVKSKVDAFIVQDFGVAHILKSSFENITLHASTQMGIHNLNGAKVAEELGFSRIVLSREATLEDIKEIKQNTNLEIEYFVQGALCVAFSGNCYLSSLEKNASGNEGKCLQLCRLPYKNNLTNEESYYLSTRDLSLLKNLEVLIDAGVSSFKIEGRMRHAGYTATATNIYKSALQLIKTNALTENFIKQSETELKITYSRGNFNQNAYLYKSNDEPIIYSDYQNHIGTKIGTVKKVESFKNNLTKATLLLSTEIYEGDGLKIINQKTKKQVASLGVGNIVKNSQNEYVIFTKSKFPAGLDVFLTQSSKNENKYLKNTKKIKVNISIKAHSNQPLEIIAQTNTVNITHSTPYNLEKSTKISLSENDFKSQFEKLANSAFELENFNFQTDGIFLPKSKINESRREIILQLENKIIEENEKHLNITFNQEKLNKINQTQIFNEPKNIEIIDNVSKNFQIDKNIIYVFEPEFYNDENISNAYKILKNNFALSVPTILSFNDRKYFENLLKKLPNNITLYANNIGAIYYKKFGYKIIASPLLNLKNNYALKCLNDQNINILSASIESEENFITTNNLISFENGNFPLMTFAHCPYKVVTSTNCSDCKYNKLLVYSNPNLATYKIKRIKLKNCQFMLLKNINARKNKFFIKNLNY